MRGGSFGVHGREYLHSHITEMLWYDVAEIERLTQSKLAHAGMLAALYGNPSAILSEGNDQIHEMYVSALQTIPYVKAAQTRAPGETDALVEEWRRVNAEAATKEGEPVKAEKREVP